MEKSKLFLNNEFNKNFDGNSFAYKVACDLDNIVDVQVALDEVCKLESLIPLTENWNKVDFVYASNLLFGALKYDLVYRRCERLNDVKAKYFHDIILANIENGKCICFTNWFTNPWKSEEGSWNPISNHTFDIAIVFIDEKKIIFTYIVGED
jgi:hypothetical protein